MEEAHSHSHNTDNNGAHSESIRNDILQANISGRASTETILEDMRESLLSSGENAILANGSYNFNLVRILTFFQTDDKTNKSHDAITVEPNFDQSLVIPEGNRKLSFS